jgi:hypothetical protein
MSRYVPIPRRLSPARAEWDDPEPVMTTTTVYAEDDAPRETGLLDANGTPLYRVSDKVRMGFIA